MSMGSRDPRDDQTEGRVTRVPHPSGSWNRSKSGPGLSVGRIPAPPPYRCQRDGPGRDSPRQTENARGWNGTLRARPSEDLVPPKGPSACADSVLLRRVAKTRQPDKERDDHEDREPQGQGPQTIGGPGDAHGDQCGFGEKKSCCCHSLHVPGAYRDSAAGQAAAFGLPVSARSQRSPARRIRCPCPISRQRATNSSGVAVLNPKRS